jgi:hypothetical protein
MALFILISYIAGSFQQPSQVYAAVYANYYASSASSASSVQGVKDEPPPPYEHTPGIFPGITSGGGQPLPGVERT